jgi:hypothetical protein
LTIKDANLLELEDAVSRNRAEGPEEGSDEIYINLPIVFIPSVMIDELLDIETEVDETHSCVHTSVCNKTIPEVIHVTISLTFDKEYKDIMVKNMEYSIENPIFKVEVNCELKIFLVESVKMQNNSLKSLDLEELMHFVTIHSLKPLLGSSKVSVTIKSKVQARDAISVKLSK